MRNAFALFLTALLLSILAACGSDDSTGVNAADASDAAATNDCTAQGPLYQCHSNPTCNAEYMPLSGISCGAAGGTCCLKGALPPAADASADASTDG